MLSCREMSVHERQRAMLERLYDQSKHQISSLPQQHLVHFNNLMTGNMMGCLEVPIDEQRLNHNFTNFNTFVTQNNCKEMARPSFSTVSNSSVTTVSKGQDRSTIVAPREDAVSTKKRKAEQFSEEEDCKTKRPEGKAGEVQSVITEKSQRGASGNSSKENSKTSEVQKLDASGNSSKENSKTSEVQKLDYIHVRARRGQATDNHSLAERARREKISKKMKYLQDLVPGCNKVTGKAGMLDEIINYVQSLQKQVEFLSMKLAALNPQLHLSTDSFFTKDFSNCMANFPTVALPTLSEYNIIQQQEGSSGVAQMLHQRRENNLMSFQESSLGSSHTTVVQQQPTFETDFQSLFQCQL